MKIPLSNTISRAARLIRDGFVVEVSPDLAYCRSQTKQDRIYDVTPWTCTCWIGETLSSQICKHRWACFAREVVGLLSDLYTAQTEDELADIGYAYSQQGLDAPEFFIKIAKDEYRRIRAEMRRLEVA